MYRRTGHTPRVGDVRIPKAMQVLQHSEGAPRKAVAVQVPRVQLQQHHQGWLRLRQHLLQGHSGP